MRISLRRIVAMVAVAALALAALPGTIAPAQAAAQPSQFIRQPDPLKDRFNDTVAWLYDERYEPIAYAYTRSVSDTQWKYLTYDKKSTSRTKSMTLAVSGKKSSNGGYVTRVDLVAQPVKSSDASTSIYRTDWTTAAACMISAYLDGLGVDLEDAKSILRCDLELPIDRNFLGSSRDTSKVTLQNKYRRATIERDGTPVRLTASLTKKGAFKLTIALPLSAFEAPSPTPTPATGNIPGDSVLLKEGVTNRVSMGKQFHAMLEANDVGKWTYSIRSDGGYGEYLNRDEIIACGSGPSTRFDAWRFRADRYGCLTLTFTLGSHANGATLATKTYVVEVVQ